MRYHKVLFKNGKIFVTVEQNGINKTILQEFDDDLDEFNNLYDCNVEFSPDLTVGGFLRALHPFIKTIEYHFASFIKNHQLSEYYEILDKPYVPQDENPETKIEFIEMFWTAEIFEFEDILNNELISDFSQWGSYHGFSEKTNYSMSLTPLNEWQHYNFRLNNTITCWKNNKDSTHAIMDKIFESSLNWCLHDLLRWFFYELTFFGSIEDQESFKESLNQQVEDLDLGILETVPFDLDDFELENLENLLKEAIDTENYEGAARIRNKIQEIKEKIK